MEPEEFPRRVTNDFDPYKLPIGTPSVLSVFVLVIGALSEELSTFLACCGVCLAMWVTLGFIAWRDRDAADDEGA